ncbi:MAG TPA: hypothetical protein VEN12_02625 [Verrucomicrobiae bacterium]|nr:hypothetical protein [Verrucomicrobiae bacterium]
MARLPAWLTIGAVIAALSPLAAHADTGTSTLDWGSISTAAAPPGREFAAMSYDSGRGRTVLFGGDQFIHNSSTVPPYLADTWEWDGSSWTNVTPTVSPPGLSGASMAYDARRGVSVLFGGNLRFGPNSSDTWEWDGAGWTKRSLAVSPPAAVLAPMAYDSARGEVVLLGPPQPYGLLATTWTYDGTTWTQRSPITSPPARSGASTAFDSVRNRVVLFGGFSSVSGRLNDTWEWDGANWAQRTSATLPFPRWIAAMVFDSHVGKTILFGGDHLRPFALGGVNDTWSWDGNQWTRLWTDAAPVGRMGHVMAYDSARARSVMFGGTNVVSPQVYYTDTWELATDITTPPGNPDLTFSGASSVRPTQVGTTSSDFSVALFTSSGTGPVTIGSMSITGEFAIIGTDCPLAPDKLAAGTICTVSFNFTPAAVGTRMGMLTLTDNGSQGFASVQVSGEGLAIPTSLSVATATAVYGGTTTISATLLAGAKPVAGAPLQISLNGASATVTTDASGVATWSGASVAGMHAGEYVGAIQASFAGDAIHLASMSGPYGSYLAIAQVGALTYTGDFYVADSIGPSISVAVNQRTPASDPQAIDFSPRPVWVRFDMTGPSGTFAAEARVIDDMDWSTTGSGHASLLLPALPDGAYSVRAQIESNLFFVSEDTRVGVASAPTKGGFAAGAGAIAADPSANTADTRGYFSLELTPGRSIGGSMTYTYRTRMNVGGVVRDVDVVVNSTDVTTLNGGRSTPTAIGHFSVAFADSSTGELYSSLGFAGGTFRLTAIDGGKQADLFGLALYKPDGSLFHTTGPPDRSGDAQLVAIESGSIVSSL